MPPDIVIEVNLTLYMCRKDRQSGEMVKLTPELVLEAMQYFNPAKERELSLRGNKIPAIENLGVTNNQFDVIDFTDNDIRRLENFPLLPRLKGLLMSNNRIQYITPDIGKYLPNLDQLILINNNICDMGDLLALKTLPKLEYLACMGNPCSHNTNYRLFIAHMLPQVRVLDFRRIRQKEREAAKTVFSGTKGLALLKSLSHSVAQQRVEEEEAEAAKIPEGPARTQEDVQRIKAAIANAKTLHEVEHLQSLLASGQMPGKQQVAVSDQVNGNGVVEEEERDDVEMEGNQ